MITPIDLASLSLPPDNDPGSVVPLPSTLHAPRPTTHQTAVVIPDDRALMGLIEMLLERAGVPQAEIARRLGIRHQSLNQYRWLRRKRPSIQWLVKLANACGARIIIEFPPSR